MTVLDTSMPHIPVMMTLGPHEPIADVTLPESYRFAPWEPRFREPWVRLHVLLGQLPSYEEGLAYFERTYGSDPVALGRQMILAVDGDGVLAGTSSLWRGDHFGKPRLRVHWVGVDPAHQRRGLARALMLRTIALYDELVVEGNRPEHQRAGEAAALMGGVHPDPVHAQARLAEVVAAPERARPGKDAVAIDREDHLAPEGDGVRPVGALEVREPLLI